MGKENNDGIIRLIMLLCMVLTLMFTLIISGCTKNASMRSPEELPDLSCPDCNIIFLNIELFRADYVGLISHEYGNNTPNIDKFFENGIIFEDANAPTGATLISNIAVLTSTDPFITKDHSALCCTINQVLVNASSDFLLANRNGIVNYLAEFPTITQRLQSQGYDTINIHEGSNSGKFAFMDIGFNKYYDETEPPLSEDKDPSMGFVATLKNIILQERITATSDKKFFLLYHGNRLHSAAYIYPKDRLRIEDPEISYSPMDNKNGYWIKQHLSESANRTKNTGANNNISWMNESTYNEYYRLAHALYAQQVSYVDDELGKIFDHLENSSLINNTIIVLYANHGDGLFDNQIPNHGVSYQSCIHVPILIRHPNIRQQIRVKTPVALIDLMPTIYAMIGLNTSSTHQGLIRTILNQEYDRKYIFGVSDNSKYVRYDDIKLIIFDDTRKELYNITTDPHELNNIAITYPEIVKELNDALIAHEIESENILGSLIEKIRKRS